MMIDVKEIRNKTNAISCNSTHRMHSLFATKKKPPTITLLPVFHLVALDESMEVLHCFLRSIRLYDGSKKY